MDMGQDELSFHSSWISNRIYVSENIAIRWIYDENQRWEIAISIDEKAGIEEIQDHWYRVLEERQKLIEFQGHDIPDAFRTMIASISAEDYISGLSLEGEEGQVDGIIDSRRPTYTELAMDINFDALVFIVRASNTDSEERAEFGLGMFGSLLRAFNWSDIDIQEEVETTKQSLASLRCPYDISTSPIPPQKLKDKVRYLKNREKKIDKEITPPIDEGEYLLPFLIWGDVFAAEELLANNFPTTYTRYKPRLDARISKMLKTRGKVP